MKRPLTALEHSPCLFTSPSLPINQGKGYLGHACLPLAPAMFPGQKYVVGVCPNTNILFGKAQIVFF